VLVDFDGTVCPTDVGDAVCERFARAGWRELDAAAQARSISLRRAIETQTAMLEAAPREMLDYALGRHVVDPSFVSFASWASDRGARVVVVSDGLGFYVRPMLAAAGLLHVPVLANQVTVTAGGLRMLHPHEHPLCTGCGTCKVQAVLRERERGATVAFVGDGMTDRYAALYADVVFAKHRLAAICSSDCIPHILWDDFDDVATALTEAGGARDGAPPATALACPGWERAATRHPGGTA
jgi:2,3-diketo-5-methylthio-1-phosphopentane phosphatase